MDPELIRMKVILMGEQVRSIERLLRVKSLDADDRSDILAYLESIEVEISLIRGQVKAYKP